MTNDAAGRGPRVSIVLAVYNGERHLRKAIQSLLTQTFRDFELIVVNDGSTDRSREIVLASSDPRVRLLDNPQNLGLTPSLNRGIDAARGEFIARLDADDVATPNRLACQIAFLDRHPEIALVGSWWRRIDETGRRLGRERSPLDHTLLRWSLLFYCPFNHSAVTWRRHAVNDAVGPYDSTFSYAMDWEYWSRIASRLRVANIGRVLAEYRVGPYSMTANHPRVVTEVRAAREASLRAVFNGAAEAWIAEGPRVFALFEGWPERANREDVRDSIDAVIQLQESFADQLSVTGRELNGLRRFARTWLADRLLASGRKAHLVGRKDMGRVLFAEARRIYVPSLLTMNSGRYFAARMLAALSPGTFRLK